LRAEAREEGKAYEAFLRVAQEGDALYLDLANPAGNVIEITADGWRPIDRPPVRFIQGAGRALPMPEKGGKVRDLRDFINIDANKERDLMILVAWLVAAFRPGCSFPILVLTGEAGSAKTTTSKMLKSLVDPSQAMGRGLPKTEDDLLVSARSNHVLAADNLSGMTAEMADAICRVSTGGGIAKRKLYEDGTEYVIEAQRPVIIAAINTPTNRQDFLSRALLVQLQPIPEGSEKRKLEKRLWKDFEHAHPKLLGALLDGVVMGLRNADALEKEVKIYPRMADFALFAAAAMPAWGWKSESFLECYAEMREGLVADAGQSDAVLAAIVEWLRSIKPEVIQGNEVRRFQGTTTELLSILNMFKLNDVEDKNWRQENRWPAAANQLSRRLRTGASGLRAMGVGFEEAGSTRLKLIQLWSGPVKPAFESKPLSKEHLELLLQETRNQGPI